MTIQGLNYRTLILEKKVQNLYCYIQNNPGGGSGEPLFIASPAFTITNQNITDWNNKLSVETEPAFTASPAFGITNQNITNWNNKLSTETDPVFTTSVAHSITQTDINNWNAPNAIPNLEQVTSQGDTTSYAITSYNEITAPIFSLFSPINSDYRGRIFANNVTDNNNYELPDDSGTFLLDTQLNGYLTLKADLVSGKVPASQLPSYVDDVLEFASLSVFPIPGEAGKIYTALNTNKIYRWGGTSYVEIAVSSYVPTSYPEIRILDYTQDATNYILRIASTHGNPSVSLVSPYYDIVVHSASLFANNVTVTMDGITQVTGTSNPYNASGQIHTLLIPKATNSSPVWNNDSVILMAIFRGVDNADGGVASPYNPRRIAYDADLIGNIKSKQTQLVSGTNIKTINGNTLLGSGDLVLVGAKNEAGQVKINYTGLGQTNFVSGTYKQFNIGAGTPTVVASPTTKYPNSTPKSYTGVFDSVRNGGSTSFAGRLIENPIAGQAHRWRIIGNYTGRTTLLEETQTIYLRFRNPVSGFSVVGGVITLAPQQVTGEFSIICDTIADSASISTPNGYIVEAVTTYTDTNLSVNITSITRFSDAIEP